MINSIVAALVGFVVGYILRRRKSKIQEVTSESPIQFTFKKRKFHVWESIIKNNTLMISSEALGDPLSILDSDTVTFDENGRIVEVFSVPALCQEE